MQNKVESAPHVQLLHSKILMLITYHDGFAKLRNKVLSRFTDVGSRISFPQRREGECG